MKSKIRAAITGVGGYLPDYVLTNQELEKMVETNDEWIVTRTGIKTRRILKNKNYGSSFMGVEAVKALLKKTNTDPETVDLLICATVTPDYLFPATSNIISHKTNLINAFSYDLEAACSGFLYGLITGSQFIETGKYKKVIIVGTDKMSTIINYQDRNSCILFGDGAGAVLLEATEEEYGIIDSLLKTDGEGLKYLYQKGGGSKNPATHATISLKEHYLYQDGRNVFKVAVNKMTEVSKDILKRNELQVEEIDFLVPHQANLRIINLVAQNIGIAEDKVMKNIHKYGNTTDATLPLCLVDYEQQLKKGDQIILTTFGGGFTWGSAYLKWAYDCKS